MFKLITLTSLMTFLSANAGTLSWSCHYDNDQAWKSFNPKICYSAGKKILESQTDCHITLGSENYRPNFGSSTSVIVESKNCSNPTETAISGENSKILLKVYCSDNENELKVVRASSENMSFGFHGFFGDRICIKK